MGRAPRGRGTCLLTSSWAAMLTMLLTYLALKPEGGQEGGAGKLVLMQKSSLLEGVVKRDLATTSHAKVEAFRGAMAGGKSDGKGLAGAHQRKQRIMMAAECDCPYADSPLSQVPSPTADLAEPFSSLRAVGQGTPHPPTNTHPRSARTIYW